jgi:hypothetical protein
MLPGCNPKRLVFPIFFISIALLLLSCGEKGPPLPPRREKPPAVKDLSYSLEGNRAKLSWTIPPKENTRQFSLAGFKLYLSKIPLSESDCKNCPQKFAEIGDISLQNPDKPEYVKYFDTLQSGYRYIFMIRGYSDNGMVSTDSNYVDFSIE